MATSMATVHLRTPADNSGAKAPVWLDGYVPDLSRVTHGATRWYATPVCAMLNHRWSSTPWSRWAFGFDRESTCVRCGQQRHERARLHADLGD